MSGSQPNRMSRRGFLGLAGAALAVPALAACNVSGSSNQSGSSGGAAGELEVLGHALGYTRLQRAGQEDRRELHAAAGIRQGHLPDHSVERLLPDLLLRDRLQDRAGGQLRGRVPGVPVRRAGRDRLRRQAGRAVSSPTAPTTTSCPGRSRR